MDLLYITILKSTSCMIKIGSESNEKFNIVKDTIILEKNS